MNHKTVAKRSKNTTDSKSGKNGKPEDLNAVLELVRALWEATDETDQDVRDDLQQRITETITRLDKQVRTKINVAGMIRSRQKADAAQIKLFEEESPAPPAERFEKAEIRTMVSDLADQALKLLPEAAPFGTVEEYRNFLTEKLSFNSVSTRKRNANYFINRFFPGNHLHPDLTAFATAAGPKRLGDVLFYLTARSERLLQLVAEQVVWPAIPIGSIPRTKVRDFTKEHLQSEAAVKKSATAIVNCYDKFGIANVTRTKININIQPGDLASFAYILHLEFPEPGMQTFEKLLDGPMHKWLLWDRQWIIEQLYLCRQEGLLSKISEIDSMRQFTTKYSLAEAMNRIVKLVGKEST